MFLGEKSKVPLLFYLGNLHSYYIFLKRMFTSSHMRSRHICTFINNICTFIYNICMILCFRTIQKEKNIQGNETIWKIPTKLNITFVNNNLFHFISTFNFIIKHSNRRTLGQIIRKCRIVHTCELNGWVHVCQWSVRVRVLPS